MPLQHVNQSYVIATSTKVDVSGVDLAKYDDKYFANEAKKKKKTTRVNYWRQRKRSAAVVIITRVRRLIVINPTCLQETESLPQEKDDQKLVDGQLMKAIVAVSELKDYLGGRFTLKSDETTRACFLNVSIWLSYCSVHQSFIVRKIFSFFGILCMPPPICFLYYLCVPPVVAGIHCQIFFSNRIICMGWLVLSHIFHINCPFFFSLAAT